MAGIGIKAFENLAREQAERLADLLNERILYERPPLDAMRKAAGPDFSDDDLYNLAILAAPGAPRCRSAAPLSTCPLSGAARSCGSCRRGCSGAFPPAGRAHGPP